MSLDGVKWLLGDRWRMNGTYPQILTTRIPRAFQRVTTDVGNNDGGVHSVILDIGSDGIGVHDIVTNSRNGLISVCHKFFLELES